MVVRLYAEEQTLNITIVAANKFNQVITAIDDSFKTYSSTIASSSISQVLMGLVGTQTFGSGWQIYQRRFPSLELTEDFLVVFDPSERRVSNQPEFGN